MQGKSALLSHMQGGRRAQRAWNSGYWFILPWICLQHPCASSIPLCLTIARAGPSLPGALVVYKMLAGSQPLRLPFPGLQKDVRDGGEEEEEVWRIGEQWD